VEGQAGLQLGLASFGPRAMAIHLPPVGSPLSSGTPVPELEKGRSMLSRPIRLRYDGANRPPSGSEANLGPSVLKLQKRWDRAPCQSGHARSCRARRVLAHFAALPTKSISTRSRRCAPT